MSRIMKVESDAQENKQARQLPTDRIRRKAIALLWIVLTTLTAIGLYGASQSHQGLLVVSNSSVANKVASKNEASSAPSSRSTFYAAQLKSDSELFRGNDLFMVSEVRFELSPTLTSVDASSLRLDPTSHDGRVVFQASNSFASEKIATAVPVSYRLSLYWKKIVPAALAILVLISLLMAVPSFQSLRSDHFLKSRTALNMFAVGGVLTVLAMLIGFNVGTPGWEYGDNHQFLATTVQGDWLPPSIYPSLGRFFPLGLMDSNLLLPFGNNPLAYHIERSILLLLVVTTIFLVARRMASVPIACLASLVFLTAPSLFLVYSASIYPEAQQILWLMLFFLFYHRVATHDGERTTQVINVIAVCLSAAAATYCKEPTFGLLLIFSALQIALGFSKQTISTIIVHCFLAANAVVFLSLYCVWCSGGESYAAIRAAGTGMTIFASMQLNYGSPIAIMAIVTAGVRGYRLLLCKDRDHVFADGLLFAGLGYAFAFCLLKLEGNYYVTPAHACWAIAFAGYLADALPKMLKTQPSSLLRNRNHRSAKLSAAVVLMAVILQGPSMLKCIQNHLASRVESTQLVKLFNDLDRDGVQLVAYMPQELEGGAKIAQDWRHYTLNVFADCETNAARPVDKTNPFIVADMSTITQIPGRKLVICPREYAHRFCSGDNSLTWQRVEQYPHVLRAFIYAQDFRVADYTIADRPSKQSVIK